MTDLLPNAAVDGLTQPETIGSIRLSAAPDRSRVSIACRKDARGRLASSLADAYGLALPAPGRLDTRGGMTILSSALDQWFLEAQGDLADDLAGMVRQALGDSASVADQSGGWMVFNVEGRDTEEMFARLCPIDLQAMGPDAVVRSAIHHIGCLVWRRDDGFAVMGPRSTATSLRHALRTAARSLPKAG